VSDALRARGEGCPAPAPDDSAGETTLGSFAWDADVGQMSCSASTLSSVDVRPDDARPGLPGFEGLIPAKDRRRIADERARIAQDATTYRLHYTVLSSDGVQHELTEIGWRLSEGNSDKCRFAGILMEKTARRSAARDDDLAPERLQAMWDNQIDPFALLEAVRDESGALIDLRYVEANSAAISYHAITREELIGATMLHFYPGLKDNGPLADYFATVETGVPVVLDDYAYDNEVKGEPRWYDLRAVQVGDGIALTWRDVTDRHATLQELAASQAHYRLLAEHSADLVVQFTVGGEIEWVSPSVTEVLGWSPEEVLGHRGVEYAHPDDSKDVERDLASAAHLGAVSGRRRLRLVDDTYRWFSRTIQSIVDGDGQLVGYVAGYRDVHNEVESELSLEASRAQYRLLAENASDVVFRASPSAVFEWVSPSVTSLLGWNPDDIVGRSASEFIHAEDAERLAHATVTVNAGKRAAYEARFRANDGTYRWMSVTARALLNPDGSVAGRAGSWRDAQSEVLAREALQASEALFRTAMDSAAIGMALASPGGAFLVVNPSLRALLGYDEAWFEHHTLDEVVHPDDVASVLKERAALVAAHQDISQAEFRLVRADGVIVWVRRVGVVIRDADGLPSMLMLQVEDISAEHEARAQLAHQAFHDGLTGLHNRAWILDMLDADLRVAERSGSPVGVFFVDLDNFKVVNDSLGHSAGDHVLRQVAGRLSDAVRPGDRLGRFGGDEFIIILSDVGPIPELERLAERIVGAISQETLVEGHRTIPSASIGIAVSTRDSTPSSLIRDADAAMFRAKGAGRSRWHFFDDRMHREAVARLTVEDELHDAITRREFVVYYQPIVTMRDGVVVGHEALVRWQHPTNGLLLPAEFLQVAEDSGLIVDIGAQVLEHVMTLAGKQPDVPGPISINVSAVELAEGHWFERFDDCLTRHRLHASRFVIEVTETSVLSTLEETHREFGALREQGAGLHLDDFGTGYSSISLLNDLPVTGLKLDARFVHQITEAASTANTLIAALGTLAGGLNLTGIAEGIETRKQARFLESHGWKLAQGYLYGRPAPAPKSPPLS
jgi:diguanylate cyclase (GGDEF)-like protein/PAS domain S-box-containing protein